MTSYGTLIRVIAGFYLGCVGNITENSVYVGDYKAGVSCKYKDETGHIITDVLTIQVNEKEFEILVPPTLEEKSPKCKKK